MDIAGIDRLLIRPEMTAVEVARIYNLDKRAVARHRLLHLPKLLRDAAQAQVAKRQEERGTDLLGEMADLTKRAVAILTEAESTGQLRTALAAIREARECLETQGKLDGRLSTASTVINVLGSPAWITVQQNLVLALRDHPVAYDAVLSALEATEHAITG